MSNDLNAWRYSETGLLGRFNRINNGRIEQQRIYRVIDNEVHPPNVRTVYLPMQALIGLEVDSLTNLEVLDLRKVTWLIERTRGGRS